MRRISPGTAILIVALAAIARPAGAQEAKGDWTIPGDMEIARVIDTRIANRPGAVLVIGVVDSRGGRVIARSAAGARPANGRTEFEIGSMSKVFTALILADMVNKGEVSLDDPAEKFLPTGVTMPSRGGREITLRDLSQHISGLPRLPDNMEPGNVDDPYADYSEAQLLAFLKSYTLTRDIGSEFEYSNLGVGLLGYLLARAAHTDYETLLRRRITGPLGMTDTRTRLTPAQKARFAQGHDDYMRPARLWNLAMFVGAGGIRSTADDMLKFLAAALDPKSPIAPAMALALKDPHATGPAAGIGLGWMIAQVDGRQILSHDGATGGFRTSMVIDQAKGRAVVAFSNASVEPSTGDIAAHILSGQAVKPAGKVPRPPVRTKHIEAELSSAQLDHVVGIYEMSPRVSLKVWRVGEVLKAQQTGEPVARIFAEGPLTFFWKVLEAQIRFTEEAGRVTGAVVLQKGGEVKAARLP